MGKTIIRGKHLILVLLISLAMISMIRAEVDKLDDGTICPRGTHRDDNKCVSNTDWCRKFNNVSLGCEDCKFWAFKTENFEQSNYCATHWWVWFLIFLGILLLLAIIGALVQICCLGKNRKKKEGMYEKQYEAHQVHNNMHLSGYENY